MAEESPKSPAMREQLNELTAQVFGKSRSDCIAEDLCVICGGAAAEFRNEISRREYGISGMCQHCQDKTFNEEE